MSSHPAPCGQQAVTSYRCDVTFCRAFAKLFAVFVSFLSAVVALPNTFRTCFIQKKFICSPVMYQQPQQSAAAVQQQQQQQQMYAAQQQAQQQPNGYARSEIKNISIVSPTSRSTTPPHLAHIPLLCCVLITHVRTRTFLAYPNTVSLSSFSFIANHHKNSAADSRFHRSAAQPPMSQIPVLPHRHRLFSARGTE